MPNTYSQVYVQIVFAVKGRENLISNQNRDLIQKYISGIIQNRNQKLLAIYCMPNHTHLLIGLKPDIVISNLVRDIKAGSSKFINDHNLIPGKFNWQHGFGAFSYSKNDIENVIHYILNQPEHHKNQSFKDEYLGLLHQFEIEYNDEYLFEWID